MNSTVTRSHYVAWRKDTQVHTALKNDQKLEIHPSLKDHPQLRCLTHPALRVWLLVDGKRDVETIARLVGLKYEQAAKYIDWLEDNGLVHWDIKARTSNVFPPSVGYLFPTAKMYSWYVALTESPRSLWRYLCNGFVMFKKAA